MRKKLFNVAIVVSCFAIGSAIGIAIGNGVTNFIRSQDNYSFAQIEASNLNNFKSGLELGKLVGFLESSFSENEQIDDIVCAYDNLASATTIEDAQNYADHISVLLDDFYSDLELEYETLESQHRTLTAENETLSAENEALTSQYEALLAEYEALN